MFAQTVNQVWGGDLPDLTLPLAVGAAARQHAIDIEQVVPLFLHAFISNLVAASQRLMPLGQTEGQRILAHLQPTCRRVANATRGATIDDISSIAFLSDITAMRPESLQPGLFHS